MRVPWRVFVSCVILLAATCVCSHAQSPRWGVDKGERVFIAKGCIGCHGIGGRGGVGPDLAGTSLLPDNFKGQVRNPRTKMPPFPEAAISDKELSEVYAYVNAAAPARAPRFKPPVGEQDSSQCLVCHRKHNPTIPAQYMTSFMFRPGRQNPRIAADIPPADQCSDCHGLDHTLITKSKGRVPEVVCSACHLQIYTEHVLDLGHSYGPDEIGVNWDRNIAVPHYDQMPRKVMEMGCDPCHAQAGATMQKYWDVEKHEYKDMSSLTYRNGCIACHTRHRFTAAEARQAQSCMTCHMGPDHPNWEAYSTSKHGAIYASDGRWWDWDVPLTDATYEAPTCAYCHMVYVTPEGVRSSSHNMTRKIIWGFGVQAAVGQLQDITATEEHRVKRDHMVRVCQTCHAEVKARGYLESADAHKLMGDALVDEARQLIVGLQEDGIIEVGRQSKSAGLLPGPRFTAVDSKAGTFWPAGLFYDVSSVEREYFDMFFFSNLKSYKGAFHISPDYAWWFGYAEVLGHLTRIRDEAGRLRSEHENQRRTLFMLYTGPLMVLLVLGAFHLLWRRRIFARR